METLSKTQETLLTAVQTQLIFGWVLRDIKTILDEKEVRFIVLKGPHLANTIYSNPMERVYCDLDLLVEPKEFLAAVNLLLSNGYKGPIEDATRLATERAFYHCSLISPQGVWVEIHRDLAGYGRYPVDIEELFKRAEAFDIYQVRLYGLGCEDLLLHLCIHITIHYFKYVEKKHLEDIALLIQKRKIDWESLLMRATHAKCASGVYYVLLAVRRQFNAEIQDHVLEELSPRGMRKRWLDLHLNPSAFPVYQYPNHTTFEVQMRLGLALMDKMSDWVPFLRKYAGIRIQDVMMRKLCISQELNPT